jgi:hypothetical protein
LVAEEMLSSLSEEEKVSFKATTPRSRQGKASKNEESAQQKKRLIDPINDEYVDIKLIKQELKSLNMSSKPKARDGTDQ